MKKLIIITIIAFMFFSGSSSQKSDEMKPNFKPEQKENCVLILRVWSNEGYIILQQEM